MSIENALASLIAQLEQDRSLDELRHLRQACAFFRLTTFHFFLHRLGVVSPKQIPGRFKTVSATP
jgi:hypothetical protein